MKSHRYAVVIEKGWGGYGAYVPDLREAIAFHVRGLRRDGDPVPRPKSLVDYVEVQLAS